MKHFYFLLFLLMTSISFGQIPTGYYDSATGSGYTLKSQLKAIIDDVNDGLPTEYFSIDNGYGGLYDTYASSDIDSYYENNGTVLDMYSENPGGTDAYEYTYEIETPDDRDPGSGGTSEGEYYNREHIIPNSVFNSNFPMRGDAHFVEGSVRDFVLDNAAELYGFDTNSEMARFIDWDEVADYYESGRDIYHVDTGVKKGFVMSTSL